MTHKPTYSHCHYHGNQQNNAEEIQWKFKLQWPRPPPPLFTTLVNELHSRVEMFLSSRLFGIGIRFQVQRGEERGRRSCYQSAAPGPKTDRTETSVQHSQTLTKTNFPLRHWTVVVSSSVKGHAASFMFCLSHSIHLSDSPFLPSFSVSVCNFLCCLFNLTSCLHLYSAYLLYFIALWDLFLSAFLLESCLMLQKCADLL